MTVTTTATATTTERRACAPVWSPKTGRIRGAGARCRLSAFAWREVCGLWADGFADRQGSGTALVLGRVLFASETPRRR